MSEDDQPDDKPLILVVDDEPLLRMDVAAMLEDAGYDVLEAADATTAIDLLEVDPRIRMLLTDVHMPGRVDGVQLAHLVATRWPMIAILVMSGVAQPAPAALPERAQFITKPFNPTKALAIVLASTRRA